MVKQGVKILDVSLRDGGYLNNWDFTYNDIVHYIDKINNLEIDFIEIGYLNALKNNAPLLNCGLNLLSKIKIVSKKVKLATMFRPDSANLDLILKERSNYIDLIRVPINLDYSIHKLATFAEISHKYGIPISLNITSITAYNIHDLLNFICKIDKETLFDLLYLADSRGSLNNFYADKFFKCIRESWSKELGFHGHDNIKLGLTNSILAARNGFNYLDGSINGFGLGGGNTNLESIYSLFRNDNPLFKELKTILNLKFDEQLIELYKLSGQRNLEQEWILPIFNYYREKSKEFLTNLQRKKYQSIDEILNI